MIEAEIRRRLVADRGVEAMARTLRKPLPEDVVGGVAIGIGVSNQMIRYISALPTLASPKITPVMNTDRALVARLVRLKGIGA